VLSATVLYVAAAGRCDFKFLNTVNNIRSFKVRTNVLPRQPTPLDVPAAILRNGPIFLFLVFENRCLLVDPAVYGFGKIHFYTVLYVLQTDGIDIPIAFFGKYFC
jgi:hypothetical protein